MYSQPLRLQGLVIVQEYAVIWGILSGSDIILGVKCLVGKYMCVVTHIGLEIGQLETIFVPVQEALVIGSY